MTLYELMAIWKVDEKGKHHCGEDFDGSEIRHEKHISVDSESACIGKPKEIIKYLLRTDEMKDYKLVKKSTIRTLG